MSQSYPKISVITVSYNSVLTIEETIKSVQAQDYPNIEYIVIDGNSTDGSKKILNQYKKNIHVLLSEPDNGLYHAMNKGIVRAKGEIIGFLNADDVFADSTVLSTIGRTFIEQRPDAVFGNLVYFQKSINDIKRYWKATEFTPGAFARGWNPPHPTFYVRRHVYQQYGGFDLTLPIANDIELMMRFLEKYRIRSVHIPQTLVKMRLGGISNRNVRTVLHQNKVILQASKKLGIPISVFPFLIGKVADRLKQRLVHS